MFMRRFISAMLTLILVVPPYAFSLAEVSCSIDPNLKCVLERIQSTEKSLQTFVAKFVQIKRTRLLRKPIRSKGVIYFDRAGKILWKVTNPSPFRILIINDTLYLEYPDANKLKKQTVQKSAAPLKKYFGFGQPLKNLTNFYEIDLSSGESPNTVTLSLVPKNKAVAKRIEAIEVVVNIENWLPAQVRFRKKEGNFTSLKLYFTVVNADLPKGTFALSD